MEEELFSQEELRNGGFFRMRLPGRGGHAVFFSFMEGEEMNYMRSPSLSGS